jgi:hypothetical protein
MKVIKFCSALLILGLLAVGGCSKGPPTPAVPEINGVKCDFPKLQRTFDNSSGEIQQHVQEAIQGVRYGMYDRSLEALDALANDATVTADQKKVVNELIESMKQVIAKSPPPAAPAQ